MTIVYVVHPFYKILLVSKWVILTPRYLKNCPINFKMLSLSVHNEPELAPRPKPINIKWAKSVEELFTANLSCTNFKGIIQTKKYVQV